MNTEYNICMGCLSVDRKLQLVNDEYKQTFYGFLDLLNFNDPVSLCFECTALLHRAIQFKKQVKYAYTQLFNYVLHQNLPNTLSQLKLRSIINFENSKNSKHKVNDPYNKVIYYNYSDSSIYSTDCDSIKYENYDHKSNKTDHQSYKTDQPLDKNDQQLDKTYQQLDKNDQEVNYDQKSYEETEPLAFIKIEDAETDYNDEISHDMYEGTFIDSDDEPLNVKSMKKKKQKPRKNKNGCVKGGRSEQPSGVVNDPRVAKKLKDLNIDSGQIALVMLSWEEVEEERQLALQSVQYSRHTHRCAACVVGFNHMHKLREHNKKHSAEAGNEVCEICTIRCKTRAALASHRRRHRARWVCQRCGARYSVACVAADHCVRAHRAPPPTHRCTHCRSTHPSLGALRAHVKTHWARPACALCGKTFRDKSSLRTHAFIHRGEKEYACTVCDKRFMFKKQKEIHEITHKEHQHLYCHQCDVSFKNQTSFYQHMKYNLKHIDPADIKHACQLCDKKFVKAKRLEEHNLAVHLKLAPIKCTLADCTFACPSRAALRSHVRLAHRGARSLRNHVCHRCGQTYKSKKSLDSHLRSHSANPSLPPAQAAATLNSGVGTA